MIWKRMKHIYSGHSFDEYKGQMKKEDGAKASQLKDSVEQSCVVVLNFHASKRKSNNIH